MSNKNTAVFGIYATPATAENGVDHLLLVGFANSAISVLLPDDETTRAFAHQKGTKAPEGATAGRLRAESSAVHLGCSQALGCWPFRV